jgi:hypothetical protein
VLTILALRPPVVLRALAGVERQADAAVGAGRRAIGQAVGNGGELGTRRPPFALAAPHVRHRRPVDELVTLHAFYGAKPVPTLLL